MAAAASEPAVLKKIFTAMQALCNLPPCLPLGFRKDLVTLVSRFFVQILDSARTCEPAVLKKIFTVMQVELASYDLTRFFPRKTFQLPNSFSQRLYQEFI